MGSETSDRQPLRRFVISRWDVVGPATIVAAEELGGGRDGRCEGQTRSGGGEGEEAGCE